MVKQGMTLGLIWIEMCNVGYAGAEGFCFFFGTQLINQSVDLKRQSKVISVLIVFLFRSLHVKKKIFSVLAVVSESFRVVSAVSRCSSTEKTTDFKL